MPAKRSERSANTGEYVKRGTEKKHPGTTVTEPRRTPQEVTARASQRFEQA